MSPRYRLIPHIYILNRKMTPVGILESKATVPDANALNLRHKFKYL